ncbi:MAG: hypothetical protein JWL63_3092 [Rhodocyclales bacterium]|nr:hypothetical protein [Rhodocyclales bacterium]
MRRHAAYVLAVVAMTLVAGCSSTPKSPLRADYPIRKILIATDNNPAIGVSGGGMNTSDFLQLVLLAALRDSSGGNFVRGQRDSRAAQQLARLQQALAPSRLKLATEISEQLARELENQGYVVEMLPQNLMGPTNDPLSIDYEKLAPLADAVVTLQMRDSTLHEYKMSNAHEPRLNISMQLLLLQTDQRILEADYYYGNDASRNKKRHFPSSRECVFPEIRPEEPFGSALARCFRDGATLMVQNAAEDIVTLLR